VMALVSYLVAIGVVITLGAVVGIVWRERNLSWRGAFGYLAGPRRHGRGTEPGAPIRAGLDDSPT
jgi:hypothetical protein